jgi:hypothetical protein
MYPVVQVREGTDFDSTRRGHQFFSETLLEFSLSTQGLRNG